MPLTVVSEQGTAGIHIVRPAGSLDSNTSPILEDHLAGLRRDGATAFVLDLKDLTYLSSAGVRVVLVAKKAMKAAGGDVALMNLQPQIRKVFDIIQALPSLSVFESVAELDRYLAGIQKKVREEGAPVVRAASALPSGPVLTDDDFRRLASQHRYQARRLLKRRRCGYTPARNEEGRIAREENANEGTQAQRDPSSTRERSLIHRGSGDAADAAHARGQQRFQSGHRQLQPWCA